jgi:hypothetical protein
LERAKSFIAPKESIIEPSPRPQVGSDSVSLQDLKNKFSKIGKQSKN